MNDTLIHLPVTALRGHTQNIRRFYNAASLRELADSIAANNGVYQALMVTTNEAEPDTYIVVDGNRRLRAGQLLGEACPLLKCEVVNTTRAAELLAMVTINFMREEPDPVSEALHYQLLREQEKLSIQAIANLTGVSYPRVSSRLKLLKLEPEIQALIGEDKLPRDAKVIDALLSVNHTETRINLALRFVADGASVRAIVAVCATVAKRLGGNTGERQRKLGRPPKAPSAYEGMPLMAQAQERAFIKAPPAKATTSWPAVQQAARSMCAACETRTRQLKGKYDEPAWLLISHTADQVCKACNVRDVVGACAQCPGVELLRTLIINSQHREVA